VDKNASMTKAVSATEAGEIPARMAVSPSPVGEGRGEGGPASHSIALKKQFFPPMNNPVWLTALKACADPERARRHLNLLAETTALPALEKASPEQAKILCALFSGSQALSALLIAHPDWLASLTPENLQFPRREQGLRREVEAWLKPILNNRDQNGAHSRLREFKQREMLRIAARDLARLGTLGEILREISDVADVCLDAVWQLCHRQFIERFGRPYHQDAEGRWRASEFCVLGLGKLGGQELNYSSDVDVIFVYSAEGTVFKEPPTRTQQSGLGPSSHQYFSRLA
jgi:glutamate-ammonia-ligase adenylyltransferase